MVGQTVPPRGRGGGGGGQVDGDVCRVEGAVVVEGAVAVQVELQLLVLLVAVVRSRRQVKWLLLQLHPGRSKCDRLSWRFLHD